MTKGYAIGSAGLGALVLFAAYSNDLNYFAAHGDTIPYFRDVGPVSFDLSNPYVVAGLIFGGLHPLPVRRHRHDGGRPGRRIAVVEEVRRQFKREARHHAGHRPARLRPGRRHADPRRHPRDDHPVAAAGAGSPSSPIYGVLFHRRARRPAAFAALGAMLLGVIVNGLFVAISMTSGGGAWDNAKK